MPEPRHILFFDGVCGFCDRLVRFVMDHDRERRFRFAPLQGDFARQELTRFHKDAGDMNTLYVLVHHRKGDELLLWKARAVVFILRELGGPWRLAGAAGCVPGALLDAAYDAFARVRYRVFGRLPACRVPTEEERGRFVGEEAG